MYNPYLDSAILIFIYMLFWFLLAQLKNDNSIVDIAWGLGFVTVAAWIHFKYPANFAIPLLLLVGLWGIRLATYLFIRNRKSGEDWRYQKWRKEWGEKVRIIAFFRVFMLQGVIMWLVALPIMQIKSNPEIVSMSPIQYGAILVWLIGFLWESIADWQLMKFKSNPVNKGKIMTTGLWKFSRHPNYFGEILIWWSIFLYTIPYGIWWISIIGAIIITFFLIKISGIPFLERKYSRNEAYQAYKETTNALIPKLF